MTHHILEIEQIYEGCKIIVKRDGTITFTPLEGKNLADMKMPPQKFWESLTSLIKNMDAYNTQLVERMQRSEEVIVQMDEELGKVKQEKKKIILVGDRKKQMFAAGVTFGKKLRNGSV